MALFCSSENTIESHSLNPISAPAPKSNSPIHITAIKGRDLHHPASIEEK